MSKTIEQLTTQIEELEKRIKIISSSQSSLSQIMAIRDCIDQIKTYLEVLNDTVDNMESSASDTELEALKARVSICEEDIFALQTDLATTQDDISTLQSSLNATNTTVGEHTTTITNLQTTQTNLQTTQSSQASTINNINSRLTKAENNISTLTGGVDLTEYDTRLASLEPVNNLFQSYVHKHYDFHNATPDNFTLFTRDYEYTCKPNVYVYQEFKLNYEFFGEGTMTIELYENSTATGESYTIDLAKYPTTYTITRELCPQTRSNNIMLKCVATGNITYKSLDITMHGDEVYIFEGNQDLKVICFNGYIYITRYYDDHIKFGKFAPTDTIDLDNLPNTKNYTDYYGTHLYLLYSPFPRSTYPYSEYTTLNDDCIIRISSKNNTVYVNFITDNFDSKEYYAKTETFTYSNEIFVGYYTYLYVPTITSGMPLLKCADMNGLTTNFENLKFDIVQEWIWCTLLRDNDCVLESKPLAGRDAKAIALGDDGCWYFINKLTNKVNYYKICKGGTFATAYIQSDGSVNVYIGFNNYTEHYNIQSPISTNSNCTHIATIENCSYVYELFDGNTIYKTPTGWVLNVVETIAPNPDDETITETTE